MPWQPGSASSPSPDRRRTRPTRLLSRAEVAGLRTKTGSDEAIERQQGPGAFWRERRRRLAAAKKPRFPRTRRATASGSRSSSRLCLHGARVTRGGSRRNRSSIWPRIAANLRPWVRGGIRTGKTTYDPRAPRTSGKRHVPETRPKAVPQARCPFRGAASLPPFAPRPKGRDTFGA